MIKLIIGFVGFVLGFAIGVVLSDAIQWFWLGITGQLRFH